MVVLGLRSHRLICFPKLKTMCEDNGDRQSRINVRIGRLAVSRRSFNLKAGNKERKTATSSCPSSKFLGIQLKLCMCTDSMKNSAALSKN